LWYGQSGSGKSSVVIYSQIYRILKDYPDSPVLQIYFSLEMSASVLLAKLLSLYLYEEYQLDIAYMDLMSIRTPLNDDLYSKVLEAKS
jgi:hypothetical protein